MFVQVAENADTQVGPTGLPNRRVTLTVFVFGFLEYLTREIRIRI